MRFIKKTPSELSVRSQFHPDGSNRLYLVEANHGAIFVSVLYESWDGNKRPMEKMLHFIQPNLHLAVGLADVKSVFEIEKDDP